MPFSSLNLFLDAIAFQPTSPVRAEIDVKLGGTQCNIIMSRLRPWLHLHLSKKKRMVLREEKSTIERPQSSDSKVVMWTCTVSAPEMTVVLYSISGLPLYHVSVVLVSLLLSHMDYKYSTFYGTYLVAPELHGCSIFIILRINLQTISFHVERYDLDMMNIIFKFVGRINGVVLFSLYSVVAHRDWQLKLSCTSQLKSRKFLI